MMIQNNLITKFYENFENHAILNVKKQLILYNKLGGFAKEKMLNHADIGVFDIFNYIYY